SGESLYASTLIKLPAPHFVVFYNGSQDAPEDLTLRLSDAFEGRKGYPQGRKEPELELKVRFLNINRGHNEGLMKRCRTLREYSEFVFRIRQYADGETAIVEAVDRAVTECIAEGILADFLRSQSAAYRRAEFEIRLAVLNVNVSEKGDCNVDFRVQRGRGTEEIWAGRIPERGNKWESRGKSGIRNTGPGNERACVGTIERPYFFGKRYLPSGGLAEGGN
ncbi:MAG TPA: hypothetical protein H9717_09425, partial [Candidatus Eisenbergiella merdipullorum]|nr:hypothetical protein [Candidatus Eisenbergiella merdipullorum]